MRHSLRRSTILIAALALVSALSPAAEPEAPVFPTEAGDFRIVTVAEGLEHPWGLAFLPDGRALVTERPGRLRILGTDGQLSAPVDGLPEVQVINQGGLLDVAVDPDFADNRWVYLSYAEPRGEKTNGTSNGNYKYLTDRYTAEELQSGREYYRRNLEISILITSVWYILNIIDATVDAHLFTYNISKDLSLKVDPVILERVNNRNFSSGIRLSLRF